MANSASRILVTGGGGFIGSHLVEALAEGGHQVRAFVRYTARQDIGALKFLSPQMLDSVEIVQGDLRSFDSVLRAAEGVRWIFHLGAIISIPYSYVSPEDTVTTNVIGTMNVLRAAQAAGVERLVHTSTSEAYGTARYVPMDEAHPLQGQSPYSASKIGADKLAESFHCAFGLPVVTIRPFNTYGPRQSTRAVIPTIISQLIRGDTLRVGNLHPTRDLTFVRDTVRAFLLAAEAPKALGRVINLGSGKEISIGTLASLIAQLMGKEATPTRAEERMRPSSSEVDRLLADASLANELLGWVPATTLEDGLRHTIEWMRAHIDFYRSKAYDR